MAALSFQEMIMLGKHDGIVLYRAKDEMGRAFFHYILADRDGVERMRRDYDAGKTHVDYASYGQILYSGWGEPTDDEAASVKAQWGAQ